ncbi:MAG: hypothetical protein AEth_01700 [Candidatus Argoarchaeum ethanivorans]|uniref:Uncharacterized protein n=1 Tax=Candidatus Argoarchaeum ethanivorans TaxID=2608793 RepID=A0A8B3RZW8_9EURY|nr:MAG: hypothetical protein AEth_01700 [Candidatus Argoarchaeum ethanivorans]
MKIKIIVILITALIYMAAPAMAQLPPTPFVIDGYVNNSNGDLCNDPTVHVTNSIGTSWDAKNSSASNYYQLVLDSDDASAGNVLRFDASGCDGSKTVNRTVTLSDIKAGGFTLDTMFSHGYPDFTLTLIEPTTFYAGQTNLIRATIENSGGSASAFDIAMKIDGVLIGTGKVWSLGAHEETIVSVVWTPASIGTFDLTTTVDSNDVIVESNETNNNQTVMVDISQPETICVPDDYDTIQKAIDNAANGTVIIVSPNGAENTYLEHVTIHENRSCIWLIANGTVVIRNDSSGGSSDPSKGDQVTVLGARCLIQGFDLSGGWTGPYPNYPGVGVRLCSDGNIVADNHIYHTLGGITINDSSSYNVIENNTIGPGILGVIDARGNYNLIANNSCGKDTGNGCPLGGTHNTITGNVFEKWVSWYYGSNNLIYNNKFMDKYMAPTGSSNIYNITKMPGTNIIGGPYLGGNYWVGYSGVDEDENGIGDTVYSYDKLPLVERIPLVGDVNGDWMITSADAVIVLQMAVCGKFSEEADVSGDDRVTSLDALMILQRV